MEVFPSNCLGMNISEAFLLFWFGESNGGFSGWMRGLQTGSSHTNNVRLYDVMAHGCVPIIVSDDFQPPLDKLLPWKEIPEGFRATPTAIDKSMTLCLIQEVYTNFSV